MAFGRESWRLADAPPTGPRRLAIAGGVGLVSVMMGLGGGTVGVPTLTLLGVPIHRAVGTAAGLGSAIAIPGAIGLGLAGIGVPGRPPGCLGYVNAIGFALIVPTTWWAAPLGARFAHAVSQRTLRRGFAFFLALTALRMLVDLRERTSRARPAIVGWGVAGLSSMLTTAGGETPWRPVGPKGFPPRARAPRSQRRLLLEHVVGRGALRSEASLTSTAREATSSTTAPIIPADAADQSVGCGLAYDGRRAWVPPLARPTRRSRRLRASHEPRG